MKVLIILCSLVAVILGEAPLFGPYPPAGWKPQGEQLKLPTEYGPPKPTFKLSDEYGPPKDEDRYEVEVEKQEFEQLVETTTFSDVSNEYLPPTTEAPSEDDFLKVQGLPRANAAPDFQQFPSRPARIQQFPQPVPFLLTGEFAPSFPLRNQQTFGRLEQTPTINREAETVNDYQPQQLPVHHGPPANNYGPPADNEPEQPTTVFPAPEDQPSQEDSNESDEDEDEEEEEPVIAIASAQDHSGQYYLLARDNTLQRVMFVTSQTEEDRLNNAFSAQLRYSPVQPITDPVYGYNEQGQLIRFYK